MATTTLSYNWYYGTSTSKTDATKINTTPLTITVDISSWSNIQHSIKATIPAAAYQKYIWCEAWVGTTTKVLGKTKKDISSATLSSVSATLSAEGNNEYKTTVNSPTFTPSSSYETLDGSNPSYTATPTYEWYRVTSSSKPTKSNFDSLQKVKVGTNSATYTTSPDDVGKWIAVQITHTKANGYSFGSDGGKTVVSTETTLTAQTIMVQSVTSTTESPTVGGELEFVVTLVTE